MPIQDELLDVLRETVIPGGIILNALRGQLDNHPKDSDLPTQMADSMSTAHTIADDLVQEVALEILQRRGRDFRINAEEDTARTKIFSGNMTSYCYHLDPLDGTLSFLEGRDGYAIGAAFSKDLVFQASVVYFPAQDRVYLAQRGQGIRVESSIGEELEFPRISPSSDYFIERRVKDLLPVVKAMQLKPLPTMGAHHGMVSIALGQAKVLMYGRASPHDFGIPQVIVEEAGGVCTDISGAPVQYDDSFNRVPCFLSFSSESDKKEFFDYYVSLNYETRTRWTPK
ncbi:MAG: inositol monophosphatase family protein [Candidatus Thorarchaeota archaeon]